MDVDFFCCPGIGMSETRTDKLDWYAFFVQGCGEIMSQSMRSEPWYPGVQGKVFTEAVQTAF